MCHIIPEVTTSSILCPLSQAGCITDDYAACNAVSNTVIVSTEFPHSKRFSFII